MAAKMKTAGGKKPVSKGAIIGELAETTGLKRKQVKEFFDHFASLAASHLSPRGSGFFSIPNLVKLKAFTKAAVPEGMRMDPFTKEMRLFKAKPAQRKVKALALKSLKDMVK
jgi:hypothetical protein